MPRAEYGSAVPGGRRKRSRPALSQAAKEHAKRIRQTRKKLVLSDGNFTIEMRTENEPVVGAGGPYFHQTENEQKTPGDMNMQNVTQTDEQSTVRGTMPTQSTVRESTKDVVVETLPTDSTALSTESLSAISHSTDLVNSSIKHLHGLLKSVPVEIPEFRTHQNAQLVNAACNCAKQISSMIRLQIDMMREMRKQPRQ
jgi:hypothetical protein